MASVLITGGAGFIGSNLSRRLTGAGYGVTALDDLSLGWSSNVPEGVALVEGDVAEAALWEQVPAADYIVHLAGASSAPMFPDNLPACFRNNIEGFIRVLDHARAGGSKRVLYASTSSVYGNVEPPLREAGPLDIPNFYAVSKYCMEQLARMYYLQYGLQVIGFRFMSVYGPREDHKKNFANLVSQFIWDVEAGRSPVVYGDGAQTRDFTIVGDICQAIQRAIESPNDLGSSVFNVGTGKGTPVNDLVTLLGELMDQPVTPQHIINPVKTGYVQQQIASIDKISAELGYEPSITLREGVEEILRFRKQAAGQ
ncbi:MAG: NAD-dependent epimerase/dehydratase [Armatimonadetes bacterium]|nr:NAD-dependent epimerase/dehydratase [Armatimonadota bacterium]